MVVTCSFFRCLSISTSGLTMWHACESNGPTQLVKSLSFLAALLKDLICSIEKFKVCVMWHPQIQLGTVRTFRTLNFCFWLSYSDPSFQYWLGTPSFGFKWTDYVHIINLPVNLVNWVCCNEYCRIMRVWTIAVAGSAGVLNLDCQLDHDGYPTMLPSADEVVHV